MTISGTLFVVAFALGMLLALLKDPIYGLFVYVAEFYLHPASRWWGAYLPEWRWSFIAAAITLAAMWLRLPRESSRQSWYATTPAKIMMLFTGWFALGYLWALAPERHAPVIFMLGKYVLVFAMVYRLINTPERRTAFLLAHVTGCLDLGILAHGADVQGRLDGVGGPGIDDSNTLGMHLATGVICASVLLLAVRAWRYVLCLVAIAFSLNAIVLTSSRGAFLALLAGGLILFYLRPRQYLRTFYAYALLGLLLFGYVASSFFWTRVGTIVASEQQRDTSAQSRVAMAEAQLRMFVRYPFGSGQRGSEIMSPVYLQKQFLTSEGARSSHNALLTVLVEQGIPGVMLALCLIEWTRRAIVSEKRRLPSSGDPLRTVHVAACSGALGAVIVGGQFADFSKCEVQFWMLAMLASLQSMAPASAAEGQEILPGTASRGWGTVATRLPGTVREVNL